MDALTKSNPPAERWERLFIENDSITIEEKSCLKSDSDSWQLIKLNSNPQAERTEHLFRGIKNITLEVTYCFKSDWAS